MAKHEITIDKFGSGGPRTLFTSAECELTTWDASRISQLDALSYKESTDFRDPSK